MPRASPFRAEKTTSSRATNLPTEGPGRPTRRPRSLRIESPRVSERLPIRKDLHTPSNTTTSSVPRGDSAAVLHLLRKAVREVAEGHGPDDRHRNGPEDSRDEGPEGPGPEQEALAVRVQDRRHGVELQD